MTFSLCNDCGQSWSSGNDWFLYLFLANLFLMFAGINTLQRIKRNQAIDALSNYSNHTIVFLTILQLVSAIWVFIMLIVEIAEGTFNMATVLCSLPIPFGIYVWAKSFGYADKEIDDT